jgi:hypothetical protein
MAVAVALAMVEVCDIWIVRVDMITAGVKARILQLSERKERAYR